MGNNNTGGKKFTFFDDTGIPVNKKLLASNWNEAIEFQNSPVQQITGSLDDTDIIIDGTKNYGTTIVETGATRTITANASGHLQGNNIKQRYQFNVDCTITLVSFDVDGNITGTIAPIPAGTYDFNYLSNRNGINLNILQNSGSSGLQDGSGTTINGNKVDLGGPTDKATLITFTPSQTFKILSNITEVGGKLTFDNVSTELVSRNDANFIFSVLGHGQTGISETEGVPGMWIRATNFPTNDKTAAIVLRNDGIISVGSGVSNPSFFSRMRFNSNYAATWDALSVADKNRIITDFEYQFNNFLSKLDTADQIVKSNVDFEGIISGDDDKSDVITDLDYTQKKYVDLNRNQQTSFPLSEEAECNSSGFEFDIARRFFVDMQLKGVIDPSRQYSPTIIRRNDSTSWEISIFSEEPVVSGIPSTFTQVARLLTSINPEDVDNITVHELDEVSGSGITGKVAVRWSEIPDEIALFNLWASGDSKTRLDEGIFDQNNSNYINNIEPAPTKLEISDFGKGDVLVYKHEGGDPEYVGNDFFTQNGVGCYFPVDDSVIFNEIRLKSASENQDIETFVRVYKTDTVPNSANPENDWEFLTEVIVIWDDNEDIEKTIKLDDTYSAIRGDFIFILYASKTSIKSSIKRWNTDPGGDRLELFFSTSTSYSTIFDTTWLKGSSTFWAVPPLVLVTTPFVNKDQGDLDPNITIPSVIYAAVDTEINLQYDALVLPNDRGPSSPLNSIVEIICDVGLMRERNYQLTPSGGDVGDHEMTIKVYDKNKQLVETRLVTLTVIAATAPSGVTNGVMIGDSLTESSVPTTTVRDWFVTLVSNIPVFWGNQGVAPNEHEGVGGWTFEDVATDTGSNPFWNAGGLDIANYRSNLGMGATLFDFMTIQLGVNDSFGTEQADVDIDITIGYATDIIDAFLVDNSSCKITIMLPTIDGNTKGGWGANYGASNSKETYQKNLWKLREAILLEFDEVAHDVNVEVGIAGLGVDRYYGYARTNQTIADRISETEEVHTNAVHPANEGYQQIGDVIFPQILGNI